MEAFILKTFPCNLKNDGIHATLLKEGEVVDIPDDLIVGLEREGYIVTGTDVPTVADTETDEDADGSEDDGSDADTEDGGSEDSGSDTDADGSEDNESEDKPNENKKSKKKTNKQKSKAVKEYQKKVDSYLSLGKEGMLETLEDNEVSVTGKETDLELAELCVAAETESE